MQGQKGDDNFMEPIVLFQAKDEKIRDHLNKPLGHKYISHDIQTELSDIMSHHVLKNFFYI